MQTEIVVRWEDKKELGTFVNHVNASFDGSICTLRLYQALPPNIDSAAAVTENDTAWIEGKQVSVYVMTKETLQDLVAVLQGVLEQPNFKFVDEFAPGEFKYVD